MANLDQQTMAQAAKWLRLHKVREDVFARVIFRILQQQKRLILRRLDQAGRVRPRDANFLLPPGEVDRELMIAANRQVLRNAVRGARFFLQHSRDAIRRISKGGNIEIPPAAMGRIREEIDESFDADYWKRNVNDNTREAVKRLIGRGIDAGLSGEQTAELISVDPSGIFSRIRANLIARTETTGALAIASLLPVASIFSARY